MTTTMYDLYDLREAELTGAWSEAFNRTQRQISAHPTFRQLVREVAVAEAPTIRSRYAYLRRNSLTYGEWMTRGNPPTGRKGPRPLRRRADYFAEAIADDLDLWSRFGQRGDAVAAVYVCAREWVHARQMPRATA